MTSDNTGNSVAEEVLNRYGYSKQPQSQQVVAVLRAVEEVIQAQSLPLTPTSYFAAIMSALEKPETAKSVDVSMARLLDTLCVELPPCGAGFSTPNSALCKCWVSGFQDW